MRIKLWWALVIVLALAALSAAPARADVVTTYLDGYTDWENASTDIKTIDFELGRSLKNGSYEIFSTAAGLDLLATGALPGELTNFNSMYTDGDGKTQYTMYVINPVPGDSTYWASGMALGGTLFRKEQQTRIRITLPSGGRQSVGLDLRSADNAGESFEIILYQGSTFTSFYTASPVPTQVPGEANYHSFWGATSEIPVTRMDVILLGGVETTTMPIIDNFRYGDVSVSGGGEATTPEPPTGMVYLTVAGLSLVISRRLKLRSKRQA